MSTVAFLMPASGGVQPEVMQCALLMVANAWQNGIEVKMAGGTDRVMIHTAREALAKSFLDSGLEWSFWMDSDMVLPNDTITRLVKTAESKGMDMACGIYHQRLGSHKPLAMIRWPGKDYEDDYSHDIVVIPIGQKGAVKIDAAGFGCMLVHRRVFEDTPRPWFKYHWITKKSGEEVEVSEDFYFCVQAKKHGHALWAIPGIDAGHIGEYKVIRSSDFVAPTDVKTIKLEAYGG